jgi:transglutaminase-like putative cysteine protease
MRQLAAYYAAGFGASALGLACFNTVLSGTVFTIISIVLTGAGFYVSWRARIGALAMPKVESAILGGLLCLLAAVFAIPDLRSQILPVEAASGTDLLMGVVLVWLMTVFSFRLTNDRSVLFMTVPGLSLIGLTATFDPNTEVLTFFGMFLALACFILIRQNTFSYQNQPEAADGAVRLTAGSTKLHIGITASVTLVALIVGIALGTLLYPRLVNTLTHQVSSIDTAQFVEQLVGEEYVPIATGPVDLSTQELMTVRCDRPLLWRGRTYNKYTGQGWICELSADEQKWIMPMHKPATSGKAGQTSTFIIPRHPLYETSRASERVEQTFSVVSGSYHTVFAASQPRIIKFNVQEPVLSYGSRIEADASYGQKTTYTVISRVNRASLRELSTASTDYPPRISDRYLTVPVTCWQIDSLVKRITAGKPDAYRKAFAIQDYLANNFAYDTSAPRAPDNEDAVTYFLLRSKRGYCDIFASSMVIMAREAGIPARWVTGFAAGELNPDDGLYHVQAKDRHAWAELYFPGYGWVEFDATPSDGRTDWKTRLHDLWMIVASDKPALIVVLVVASLLAFLIKSEVIDRLGKFRKRPPTREEVYAAEISKNYRRMCAMLARAGYPRHPSTTPWEYSSVLAHLFTQDLVQLSTAVDAITADFVQFRYSSREPSPDGLAAMSSAVQSLARTLKMAKKRNLLPRNGLA